MTILPVAGKEVPVTEQDRRLTERFTQANPIDSEKATQLLAHARCILCMPGAVPQMEQMAAIYKGLSGRDTTRIGPYILYFDPHP